MLPARALFDGFVSMYAVSLVLLFVDSVQPRRAVNRTALVLLFASFCLETTFFLQQLWLKGTEPLYTPFDVVLLLVWCILLVALVVNTFFRAHVLLFLANLLGFLIVAFAAFSNSTSRTYTAPRGDLLVLHIVLAVASYGAFSFAFLFSVMYLLQERILRSKRWGQWFFRLPALHKLDLNATRSLILGFGLLVVAMILGVVWGKLTTGWRFFMDPKVWGTGVVALMYAVLLTLRLRLGWGQSRLVWYSIVCFIGLLINFVVISNFSIYHRGL